MKLILALIGAAIFVNVRRPYRAIDRCIRKLSRGNLNALAHGNPELNREQSLKCVETIDFPSHADDEIVQAILKNVGFLLCGRQLRARHQHYRRNDRRLSPFGVI